MTEMDGEGAKREPTNFTSNCYLLASFQMSVSNYKGHATRNDIVDDIVDFSSSTMAFNVANIASARASLTISLTKSLRVAGR